jgi:hypothetical protein
MCLVIAVSFYTIFCRKIIKGWSLRDAIRPAAGVSPKAEFSPLLALHMLHIVYVEFK